MQNLCNIVCTYNEFRLLQGVWIKVIEDKYIVNSSYISNMKESQKYYKQIGGVMHIIHKKNRRFGDVPVVVTSISICKTIKKVYKFNYNSAQLFNSVMV